MSSNELANSVRGIVPRACALLGLVACNGGSRVEYVDGKCLLAGVVSTLGQVQTRQAEVTQHVLSRQPILTAIAVAAVALAGASYVQRILTVLAARRAPAQGLADRLRNRMERYRAHPLRYFLILSAVLATLIAAGGAYIALDADKRASERALTSLQFCHLALRSAEEQHTLAEQRDNLATIQATAGDIRSLVDKLPPAEQQKAHEIVNQLSSSLGQQSAMVTRYAQHADLAAHEVAEHQAVVERGLSRLTDDVVDLKSVPSAVGKLSDELHSMVLRGDTLAGELGVCNTRLDTLGKGLDAVAKQVDVLANRPPPTCPACTCQGPVTATAPPPTVPVSTAVPAPARAPSIQPKPATTPTANVEPSGAAPAAHSGSASP